MSGKSQQFPHESHEMLLGNSFRFAYCTTKRKEIATDAL